MIANLYLSNKSFIYNQTDSIQLVSDKIQELQSTIFKIKKNAKENRCDEDQIFNNSDFYDIKIFKDHSIIDIAYGQHTIVDRDAKKMLGFIIDRSKTCDENDDEIQELIQCNNVGRLTGLLCLNSINIPQLPSECFIHEIRDWFCLHRTYLAHFPKDVNNFFEEIKKYFFNIIFHPRIRYSLNTLNGGLEKFSKKIIHSLSKLNDNFHSIAEGKQLSLALREFGLIIGEECSLENNKKNEKDLIFVFENDGESKTICCEPHIKLLKCGIYGDNHPYSNRIYFHQGLPDFCGGKILVGHIGGHL